MTARDRNQAVRSWQEIAKELTKETDSGEFERLAGELLKALEGKNIELPHPSAKPANRSD